MGAPLAHFACSSFNILPSWGNAPRVWFWGSNATLPTSGDEGVRSKDSMQLSREHTKRKPSVSTGCSHRAGGEGGGGSDSCVGRGWSCRPGAADSGAPMQSTGPAFHKDAQEPTICQLPWPRVNEAQELLQQLLTVTQSGMCWK